MEKWPILGYKVTTTPGHKLQAPSKHLPHSRAAPLSLQPASWSGVYMFWTHLKYTFDQKTQDKWETDEGSIQRKLIKSLSMQNSRNTGELYV